MHGAIVAGEVGFHSRDETVAAALTEIPGVLRDIAAVGERSSARVAARAPIGT